MKILNWTFQKALSIILILFYIGPIYWLLNTSFKRPIELLDNKVNFLPKSLDLGNYVEALQKSGIKTAFVNSIFVTLISTVIIVLFVAAPAYFFARKKNALTRGMSIWILVSQVFPLSLIIIPLFLTLQRLHLVNTTPGLILVYIITNVPFSLWLLRTFIVGIPFELEEAGSIDGAKLHQILRFIILPLVLPGVLVVALFTFVNVWNEFFFALVLISDPDKSTLPLKLAQFLGSEGRGRIGALAAATVLSSIPAFFMYALIQRKFSDNLIAGATKG